MPDAQLRACGNGLPPKPCASHKNIVFGIFKGMGDLLSAMPVVKAEVTRGARVLLLTTGPVGELLKLLDLDGFESSVSALRIPEQVAGCGSFIRALASFPADLVWVSPHAPFGARGWKVPLFMWLLRTIWWRSAQLSGTRCERLSWLFDTAVQVDRDLPFIDREWSAYFGGGAAPGNVAFRGDIVALRNQDPVFDVLVFPAAGAANRTWPYKNYRELLKRLPAARVAICAPKRELGRFLESVGPLAVTSISGSLEEAVRSIARSRLVLCMDSGPMFFANSLGVPTVAVFGASNPANVVRLTENVSPIWENQWKCQPCGSPTCRYGRVYCLESLPMLAVLDQVQVLLQGKKRDCAVRDCFPSGRPQTSARDGGIL